MKILFRYFNQYFLFFRVLIPYDSLAPICGRILSHRCQRETASFLHEQIRCVLLDPFSQRNFCNKCHIEMVSFPHELIQCVFSGHSSEKTCTHRFHIEMAFFLHE